MKVLRLFNRQRARAVDRALLRRIARCLLDELCLTPAYEIAVHLIGAREMTRLNGTFLGHEGSTDVITFDYGAESAEGALRGEIFISVDDAAAQAPSFRSSWQAEIVRYMVHGILHLQGGDDTRPGPRRVMKRRENKLSKALSRRFVLGKLERRGTIHPGKQGRRALAR